MLQAKEFACTIAISQQVNRAMKMIAFGLLLALCSNVFPLVQQSLVIHPENALGTEVNPPAGYSGQTDQTPEPSEGSAIQSTSDGVPIRNSHNEERLQNLLSELQENTQDESVRYSLYEFLNGLVLEAEQQPDEYRISTAEKSLKMVESIDPFIPKLPSLRTRLDDLEFVNQQLELAQKAFREGRVEAPDNGSALFHYRQVLQLDPLNQKAMEGVASVQRDMIARALKFARELDFESATILVDEAGAVREAPELTDNARRQITAIRQRRELDLEAQAIQQMADGEFTAAERTLIDLVALGGARESLIRLRQRLEAARIYGGFKQREVFRDEFINQARWAPDLIIISAGSFVMGSPSSEKGRLDNESPQHRVTFRRGFAMGLKEVTVAQFREFIEDTGFNTDAERAGFSTVYDQGSGRLTERQQVSWQMNYAGQVAQDHDPVVHVSWNDSGAYADWLSRGTGKTYRLPTESEFEYALRGGRSTRYWWGDNSPEDKVENLTGDQDTATSSRYWSTGFRNYRDGYWGPSPAGSFRANPFGLYDIGGNVAEWVEDCWHETYMRAPVDGTAWVNPGCSYRIVRGGYWASSPDQTRSAFRLSAFPDSHDGRVGFRIVREL
jgi:formylglycine-generating enzyme required for sulfatase activity